MKKVVLFCVSLAAIIYLYHITGNHEDIPFVSSGNATIFHAQLSSRKAITDEDATNDLIFFMYSQLGVVEAYNWDGQYQFSIAVYSDKDGHGRCAIRCEENLLYIQDFDDNIIVFQGQTILRKYQSFQSPYSKIWFNESSSVVKQQGRQLVDSNGNYIMVLPGIGEQEKGWMHFVNVLMVVSVVIITILLECKKSPPRRTGYGSRSLKK